MVPTSLKTDSKNILHNYFAKRGACYMLAGLFDDGCGSVVHILFQDNLCLRFTQTWMKPCPVTGEGKKNTHKTTKSLGSMHFDRSGLHTLSHSSKHTIQNHTSTEKTWFAPCSFSFLMLFFLLRHGQPDSDGSPESVRWSRRGPWSKQPERFWNIYHPVDGYVDKV